MSISSYNRNRPFFSIVMCTWNRHHSIVRAIESVLAQSFEDWELIIVDDGSTDGTAELVRPFTHEHEHIVYVHHKHRGQALSRNAGLRLASGLFVTFLDSDDYYQPCHLETRNIMLLEYPEVTLLHGGVEVIGPDTVPDKDDPSVLIPIDECIGGARRAAVGVGGLLGSIQAVRRVQERGEPAARCAQGGHRVGARPSALRIGRL